MPPVSRYPVQRQRDPLNAQAYRTQRVDQPEDLWQPLYDRANVATTVPGQVAFFSTPIGQSATLITGTSAAAKVKTYRDTNMQNSNVVPTKLYKFVGISMGIVHSTRQLITNPADQDFLMDGGYFQFKIVDKDLLFLPLLNLPLLNPVASISQSQTTSTMMSKQTGGGAGNLMYKLPINITLNPYENFACFLNFDGSITLAATLDVLLVLQGFQRRPT